MHTAAPAQRPGPAAPAILLPPVPQAVWGWPAVLNFALGGLGAGLYVMAALAAASGHPAALRVAAWLGPLLVLAGFVAVATEAGRPLRGVRVLTRVRTSWMSRELWLGGVFALGAAGSLVADGPAPRVLAALAAVALALAQGQILRQARGVAAWAVPPMPAVFLTSALMSGGGLLLLLEAWSGHPADRLLGLTLVLLIAHVAVWSVFLGWSREPAFVEGIRPLRDASGGGEPLVGNYLLPSLLVALAIAVPALGRPLAAAAGLLMIAGQVATKATLIRKAGQLRPITLPAERLGRRSS
jgi:DMSO reductase anchor subunit